MATNSAILQPVIEMYGKKRHDDGETDRTRADVSEPHKAERERDPDAKRQQLKLW